MTKHDVTPYFPINIPAIAGPIILAILNATEFKETAFIKSFLSTRLTKNECRAGVSNAFVNPIRSDSNSMWNMIMLFVCN